MSEDAGNAGLDRSVLVLATVGVILIAAIVAAKAFWPATKHDTLVVGDSVTFLSIKPIQERLGVNESQIIARPGYRSIDLLPKLREAMVAHKGASAARDRATFLVGYNDVQRKTVGADALPAMIKASNGFRCALWFTLPERPGGEPTDNPKFRPEAAALWNTRIRDLAKREDNVHVAEDWKDVVESGSPGKYLQADGVHPNGAGRVALAQAMQDALDREC